MVKHVPSTSSHAQHHRASLAWTPPPIYTAIPSDDASASTRTDRQRQEGRYNFLVPETITEPELAMQAQTSVGDGMPHISNLW